METKEFTLSILPEKLAICHLDRKSSIPAWATDNVNFSSISKTPSELSIVCSQEKIPGGILAEKDWRAFRVDGSLGFVSTGVVASFANPLAEAKISIFYISTYETDYLLVKEENLEKAKEILESFCNINTL